MKKLGDSNIEVRLNGLETLENLTKEKPRDFHNKILSVLCDYVKENTPKIGTATEQTNLDKPREDVQTALTIIGKCVRYLVTNHLLI